MANPWTTFAGLITKTRRTVGKVQSTSVTTDRVKVLPVGGGTPVYVESNGSSYVTGSYVFMEGGVITGKAPEIRSATIELLS